MDADFLKGVPVTCKVAFDDQKHAPLQVNDSLVVVLSSGKKFKGKVNDVRIFKVENFWVGEVDLVRL